MSRHRPKRMVRIEITWEQLFRLLTPMLPADATLNSNRIIKTNFDTDGVERLCIKVESDKFQQVAEGALVPLYTIDI